MLQAADVAKVAAARLLARPGGPPFLLLCPRRGVGGRRLAVLLLQPSGGTKPSVLSRVGLEIGVNRQQERDADLK